MIGCQVYAQKKKASKKMRSRYVHSQCWGQGGEAGISGPSHDPEIHGQGLIFERIKAWGKSLIPEKCGFPVTEA